MLGQFCGVGVCAAHATPHSVCADRIPVDMLQQSALRLCGISLWWSLCCLGTLMSTWLADVGTLSSSTVLGCQSLSLV